MGASRLGLPRRSSNASPNDRVVDEVTSPRAATNRVSSGASVHDLSRADRWLRHTSRRRLVATR